MKKNFHEDPFSSFYVKFLTDRQEERNTERHIKKHNLFGSGEVMQHCSRAQKVTSNAFVEVRTAAGRAESGQRRLTPSESANGFISSYIVIV